MTAKKRVTIIELSVYENTVPLVAGYLQAYAQQDPLVRDAFEFDIFSASLSIDQRELVETLRSRGSDTYAFSCYIWNMGLITRVLPELMAVCPDAYYVLGGPQVINHFLEYAPVGEPKVVVCHGEGEHTFYELLRQLRAPEPDLSQVSGISYWSADGQPVETDKRPRIGQLDDIPSPFGAGIFDDGEYTFTVLETNRGCPFSCGFCFWGAATQSKVYKFDEDRVKADIDWIAEHGVASVFIADANWGHAPRDVELSRHIVAAKQEHGFPTSMVIAAAKNRPERVAEITEILVRGGLVTSQPISLQTVNPTALKMIDRANIRETTYTDLQRSLRERDISSFVEMIWPLPGETLDSFKAGIAKLCRLGADTLTIYPQLLLHNTALYNQKEVMGLEVERASAPEAEADVVVATKWVTREECVEGTWCYYAMHSLYNARGLYHLSAYLDRTGVIPYEQFFTDASFFLRDAENPVSRFFAESVDTADNYSLLNVGKVAHMLLQSRRAEFDELLLGFCQEQEWWSLPYVPLLLDLDLLARPYVYRENIRAPGCPLSRVKLEHLGATEFEVSMADDDWRFLVDQGIVASAGERLRITHPQDGKMPHPRQRDMEHNAAYCHVMIQRLRQLLPVIRPVDHTTTGDGRRLDPVGQRQW
ncbi:B12-binding domain-containing radical SAM protein [Actinocrispum wychmicini]|uniref:Radical SAM superfamily enzyme YgiQ (UPF0313 family) n=1 Tax=Actinocrispum wychmicini TaxID=1213861 RepID=A0A4R2K4A9_9PSEU|nr:radical SAM protein [Actinocrispum wychmicini]TCO61175.1 radical SAM superfamily enzyme YgiQ (UPF0313 family) [Actinocrispum wychmicini]